MPYGKIQTVVRVTKDFKETTRIWEVDPPDTLALDEAFLTTGGMSQIIAVANGASDQQLSIGGLSTAKLLHLWADGGITVKLNTTGGTALPIGSGTSQAGLLTLVGDGITAVYVSNSSGSTRALRYAVAG